MSPCATVRQSRGAALVIAILMMAVLLLAGTTFLTISSTENQIASNERAGVQAFMVAEAALARGVAKLSADPSYGGETGVLLADGTATIAVSTASFQPCPGNSAREVTATGSVNVQGGQARAQVGATVDRWYQGLFRWAAFSGVVPGVTRLEWDPYDGAWVDRTGAELRLKDDSTTDSFNSGSGPYNPTTNRATSGDVGSNSGVLLNPNAVVQGNITAADNITMQSGASVTGLVAARIQAHPLPAVSFTGPSTATLTVAANEARTLAAGTHYFATMEFGDGSSLTTDGPATIYVAGAVTIGHNVTLGSHPGTNLRIIAKSSGGDEDYAHFVAGNNFRLFGGLYGRNANVSLGDHAVVYGSVISRMFAAGPHASIHYDTALMRHGVCGGGPGDPYVLVRGTWREIVP